MAIKCLNCGSTAQLSVMETDFQEDGWTVERTVTYRCGCGKWFTTTTFYEATSQEEINPNDMG